MLILDRFTRYPALLIFFSKVPNCIRTKDHVVRIHPIFFAAALVLRQQFNSSRYYLNFENMCSSLHGIFAIKCRKVVLCGPSYLGLSEAN